ncbi:glycosyltransferase [Lactococcus hircilactis]|uniref:Glycosyltransferase n=1 Tax=Lactococcus hircilactis TaxID=1494462 RepID=A0A7X1Z7E1_9LACT|nr:glycosyltransferase [Lactococcus hircilactis]MQW39012.1 glycosyltransferase [Lactococcus hircilactis]
MEENKIKLLLITQSGKGGLRKHLCDLLENLDYGKFEVWIAYNDDEVDDIFRNTIIKNKNNIKPVLIKEFVREINLKNDFISYIKINKLIKSVHPDIVHCHSSKAGVIGRIAAKKNHVKKIFYTSHWYSFLSPEFSNLKRKIFVFLEKMLSRYATTRTFSTSNGEKQGAIEEKLDKPDKFRVIYNGLSTIPISSSAFLRKELNLTPQNFIFGNTARLNHQKNPELFVEIAMKVIKIDSNIHFIWIGDGNLKEKMEKKVKENFLEKNIHFLGHKDNAEFIVSEFDAFISTSNGESFGYSAVEALRSGVPVFLTNVMGHSEIVIPEVNGRLFESFDILKNIDEVFNFIELSKKLKKPEIINSFENRFTINKMMSGIYEEYLSNL